MLPCPKEIAPPLIALSKTSNIFARTAGTNPRGLTLNKVRMKVSIGKRKLANGRVALYLSIYHNGQRTRANMGITLDKPTTPEIRRINRQKYEMAICIRARQEIDLLQHIWLGTDCNRRTQAGKPVSQYLHEHWQHFATAYAGADQAVVHAVGKRLRNFAPLTTTLEELTPAFCADFWKYLSNSCHLRGHTPAGYYSKFRQFLNELVAHGHLTQNPANRLRTVSHGIQPKVALNLNELALLAATPCSHPQVKDLFLFCCNTGLRWSDASRLTLDSIDWKTARLQLTQHKVAGHSQADRLNLYLNANARLLALRALKRKRSEGDNRLFAPPSYNRTLQVLDRWVRKSGIDKHITFHCARHTFITNLISLDVNLNTVAALAGHSSTRHTEVYVHLREEETDAAVKKLPPLNL